MVIQLSTNLIVHGRESNSQLLFTSPMPLATFHACKSIVFICVYTGVVAYEGLLYVVGGDDGSSNLSSVECYNPKSDSWTMLASSLAIGRSYAGVSVIDRPI